MQQAAPGIIGRAKKITATMTAEYDNLDRSRTTPTATRYQPSTHPTVSIANTALLLGTIMEAAVQVYPGRMLEVEAALGESAQI